MYFYTSCALMRGDILLRGFKDGQRVEERIPYKPYLFIPTKDQSEYKTLEGKSVERVDFDTPTEARDFISRYKDVRGFSLFGMERFVYTYLHDNFPGEVQYDPELIRVGVLDIEVEHENGFPDIQLADRLITAISMRVAGKTYAWGYGDFKTDDPNVVYHKAPDEKALLRDFITIWKKCSLDVVTGWNVEFFDVPYLINRIRAVLGTDEAKLLSPWNILQDKTVFTMGKDQQSFVPVGIAIIDYLQLYKKYAYIRAGQDSFKESMKLDYIAWKELGEKKLDYSVYKNLNVLYKENHQLFMEYNIKDCYLVEKLEDKLKYIELVFAVAYDAKVNYNDAFTSVLLWDVIIYNYLMDRNIVLPRKRGSESRSLPGAFVKHPQAGLYKWVLSADIVSSYPHQLIQYNISPETFVAKLHNFTVDELLDDKLTNTNYTTYAYAGNGCAYRKDVQGFIPALMELQFAKRNEYKKKMGECKKAGDKKGQGRYNAAQLAKKVQLNSCYGALANEGFRFFDINHAEAVTLSGQLAIRWAEKALNTYMNKILSTKEVDYVIYVDTDSLYINCDPLVQRIYAENVDKNTVTNFLDKVAKEKIEPILAKAFDELAEYMNAYKQVMVMKREAIANKAIWKAKKMYIVNVIDNEGERYAEPKLKVMGIEAVRSSTPDACKTNIITAIKKIINEDEESTRQFINEFREKFMELPYEEVASPRGMNGLDKYSDKSTTYKLGCPIHVKGALIYNKLLKQKGLKGLEPIYNGTKVKFAYLKLPNPTHEAVIATPGHLPKELGLDDYIDRNMQFEKSFLEPVKSLLDVIGWEYEPKSTLEDFFG